MESQRGEVAAAAACSLFCSFSRMETGQQNHFGLLVKTSILGSSQICRVGFFRVEAKEYLCLTDLPRSSGAHKCEDPRSAFFA